MAFRRKKGDQDADLDAKKASLFGARSKAPKSASPAPPSANPYAAAPATANDPYAQRTGNPYATQSNANDPYAPKSQPPTSSFKNMSLNGEPQAPPSYSGSSPTPNRYDKSPVPPGGYGGGPPRYQNQGGYGSDPYGGGQSQYGAGGYGGLGRSNSQETMSTDAGRNALFGDAAQRAQPQQQQQQQMQPGQQSNDHSYSNSGGYGSSGASDSHGYGGERELTAEEQEEQEVDGVKQEIRFIKQQDVASTRNARRIAEQSEQIGRETLQRLGQQGDMIHNTERNLDQAQYNNRLATDKAGELKHLNRSMFAPNVKNPFTKNRRYEEEIQAELEKRQRDRAIVEATRKEAYDSQARHQNQQRDINGNVIRQNQSRNLADRAKYQFEADSEDDEIENEIEDNLQAVGRGVRTLNTLGKAMSSEIEAQNRHLDRISGKTEKVDDSIALNTARLRRIEKRG